MSIRIELPNEDKWNIIAEGDETACDVAILKDFPIEIRREREGRDTTFVVAGTGTAYFPASRAKHGKWAERYAYEQALQHALRLMGVTQ